MAIKRKAGRPRGTTKAVTASDRVALRLLPEQRAKVALLPGLTLSEKIRRLIDSLPAV